MMLDLLAIIMSVKNTIETLLPQLKSKFMKWINEKFLSRLPITVFCYTWVIHRHSSQLRPFGAEEFLYHGEPANTGLWRDCRSYNRDHVERIALKILVLKRESIAGDPLQHPKWNQVKESMQVLWVKIFLESIRTTAKKMRLIFDSLLSTTRTQGNSTRRHLCKLQKPSADMLLVANEFHLLNLLDGVKRGVKLTEGMMINGISIQVGPLECPLHVAS